MTKKNGYIYQYYLFSVESCINFLVVCSTKHTLAQCLIYYQTSDLIFTVKLDITLHLNTMLAIIVYCFLKT